MQYEKVNHPTHYQSTSLEAIEVIEDYDLNFSLGSAFKYLVRCGRKPGEDTLEDLDKAVWYLKRELDRNAVIHAGTMSPKQVTEAFGITSTLSYAVRNLLCGDLKSALFHTESEINRIKSQRDGL